MIQYENKKPIDNLLQYNSILLKKRGKAPFSHKEKKHGQDFGCVFLTSMKTAFLRPCEVQYFL